MDPRVIAATRAEWRELGFYYEHDGDAKEWRLVGSRAGLLPFTELLRAYVADPLNDRKAEHEHYGPYCYLEIMTWPEPGMDWHAIHGPLDALANLAALVEERVSGLRPGEEARIREEFAPDSEDSLVLELRPDGFDPASADEALPAETPEATDCKTTVRT